MLPQEHAETASGPLPPTHKQVVYARSLASKTQSVLPWEALQSRNALSHWIDARVKDVQKGRVSDLPSSKQVAFAERIATIKRTQVPDVCFKSRESMSRWLERYGR